MFNNKSYRIPLAAIFLLCFAAMLRLYQLGTLPKILNPDEAAIGYNAYLLKETGSDEWGKSWPVTLKSFGDYKLIGYPAITVFFFHLMGETEFAVRIFSALAGIWLMYCMYVWNSRLYKNSATIWFMTVLSAFTPVFFFYSRMAFEANAALAILVTVLLLIFKSKNNQQTAYDVLAVFLYAFACITYNTPLLLLPFFLLILVWWRGVFQWKRWILVVAGLLLVGVLSFIALRDATAQKTAITLFSDPMYQLAANEFRINAHPALQPFARAELFYFLEIVKRVLHSFGAYFMVMRGGAHPWHSLPYWGHVFWLQYVLAIIGTVFAFSRWITMCIRERSAVWLKPLQSTQYGQVLLTTVLMCIGLLPAVVTTDAPHATRSLLFFFFFISIAGMGFEFLLQNFSNLQKKLHVPFVPVFIACSVVSGVFSASNYLYQYFQVFPDTHPRQLRVGFDSILTKAVQQYPNGTIAVVDPDGTLYILASWYLHLDPNYFFKTIVRQAPNQIGFQYGEQVDRLHFVAQPGDRGQDFALIDRTSNETNWVILQ